MAFQKKNQTFLASIFIMQVKSMRTTRYMPQKSKDNFHKAPFRTNLGKQTTSAWQLSCGYSSQLISKTFQAVAFLKN